MRPRALALLAAPLLVATSCGDDSETEPVPSFPVDLGQDFVGSVEGGNRLVISASDGRVLLDGLAPGNVEDGAPPLVGFAARTDVTTYEMQFGAFKPTVTPEGPWRVVRTLRAIEGGLALEDEQGELARLTFAPTDTGYLRVDLAPGPDGSYDPETPERATKLSWGFACDAEDHFAGFGAQTWDADHRGQTLPLMVTEGGIGKSTTDDFSGLWQAQGQRHSSHAPLPFMLARRGYVLVAETDRRSTFALCSEDEKVARFELDLPASVHLFDGPAPTTALERSSAVFGRPRMPPPVAFAPWLDAVFGSENVRRVAEKLREEEIPVSVIWTEDWRGGEWEGDNYTLIEEWEVDRTLYPDIEEVASDLHDLGFDFHIYFNPFVYVGSKAWDETEPNGWLVKRSDGEPYTFTGAKFTECGLIDPFNPDARAWAVGKMRDGIALGADGWMNDFAEWLPMDAVTDAGLAYDLHNVYAVAWQEIAREAIDEEDDGTPELFFARSGWFGTPDLADVFWAGDQRTTLDVDDGYPTLIPQAIGLGIAGISTYGHDIAGYQAATNPGSTKEVFFRWTSLGAWSPVMRTHHGNQPDKCWNWEKDADTIAHFKRYAELHMSLVPTFRGLAQTAADSGLPMWRGLALHMPEDPAVWPITDQILLGDGVMIAPVSVEGETSREVYFPAGRWYAWDGTAAVEGPTTETVSAAVEEIPVFARAGAIVPMYPAGVMTLVRGSAAVPDASSVGDDRVVRVFLGADGGFADGDGLTYTQTTLAEASGDLAVSFDGAPLEACGDPIVAPCVEAGPSEATAHVTVAGQATLTVSAGGTDVATFTTAGGEAGRALTVIFRN